MHNKAIFFIFISLLWSCSDQSNEMVDFKFFKESLESGQVEKIKVINEKDLFFDVKTRSKKITTYQMKIPPEINILEQVENIYSKTKIPKGKQVYPEFRTKENWMAPFLGFVLPMLFSLIFTIVALIFMLQKEERYPNYKIIWALVIFLAPLGWLIFLVIEILIPKLNNR